MKPQVSIIVPVYNVEKYIARCLESILQQTFKDFEVILINDGSTDNSGEICNEYAQRDNRIKVIETENRGLSNARNLGINYSVAKYIIFCDSDDWMEKNSVEVLFNSINSNDFDVVICGYFMDFVDKNKSISFNCVNKEYISIESFLENYQYYRSNQLFGFSWNKIFKLNIIKENNIEFESNVFCEDLYFMFNVLTYCQKIKSVNFNLYHYMQQSANTLSKKKKDEFKIMNEIYDRTIIFLKKNNSYENNKIYLNTTYIECVIAYIAKDIFTKKNRYKVLKQLYKEDRLISALPYFKSHNIFYIIIFWLLKFKLSIFIILFLKLYYSIKKERK